MLINHEFTHREGHSKLGIASFVLPLVWLCLYVVVMAVAVNISKQSSLYHVAVTAWGLVGMGFFVVLVISLVLAVRGIVQKKQKRLFAILGFIVSLSIFLVVACFSLGDVNRILKKYSLAKDVTQGAIITGEWVNKTQQTYTLDISADLEIGPESSSEPLKWALQEIYKPRRRSFEILPRTFNIGPGQKVPKDLKLIGLSFKIIF